MTKLSEALELAWAWALNLNDDFAPGSVRDDARQLARALIESERRIESAFAAGFDAGFAASGDGFHSEYPFRMHGHDDIVAEGVARLELLRGEAVREYIDQARGEE